MKKTKCTFECKKKLIAQRIMYATEMEKFPIVFLLLEHFSFFPEVTNIALFL